MCVSRGVVRLEKALQGTFAGGVFQLAFLLCIETVSSFLRAEYRIPGPLLSFSSSSSFFFSPGLPDYNVSRMRCLLILNSID